MANLPKALLDRISTVKNKRAKIVVDTIVEKGIITTGELKQIGYDHPPRAARDVRELGIPLKTTMVKDRAGKRMGAYTFDTKSMESSKTGRKLLPKKIRDQIIDAAENKCALDGAEHNLQVDHRIPFEVAGETLAGEERPYQVLCGSCNRQKSWACEHCQNWLLDKKVEVCRTCYWANPENYNHIAMRQERRVDLVWVGDDEIASFAEISNKARKNKITVAEQIKRTLTN